MPTAASSTSTWAGTWAGTTRAAQDVVHLARFRAARLPRRTAVLGAVLLLLLTAEAAVLPGLVADAGGAGAALDARILLPSLFVGFVVLAGVAASASGGGRELLARDPAGVHPISPTTDHLGALLLAPLNIAWLVQAWGLLGVTAFAIGADSPTGLLAAQLVVVAWLGTGTAFAQLLAWSWECVRRTRHGTAVLRGLVVLVLGAAVGLQLSGRLTDLLDRTPTRWIVLGMLDGFGGRWAATVLAVVAGGAVLVAAGAVPAHLAARRLPRDEQRVETGLHRPRPVPGSLLGLLVRVDRASVWRAVPMRRGLLVLALGPGVVAVLGDLAWESMTLLPGLVAAGGALLYGVNAWCLDGRGVLWRESLPVAPTTVFDARAYVLAEFLLAASLITILLAGVRAGVPTPAEAATLAATLVVVTVQVVAGAMRWSSRSPYAVDLRSARATPAPPAAMVGYSSRLALSTTVTGLTLAVAAELGGGATALLLAVPMLCWSTLRLLRTRRTWDDAPERARVVLAVSA